MVAREILIYITQLFQSGFHLLENPIIIYAMKNKLSNLFLAAIALFTLSCQDKIEETYEVLAPEYMSYDQLRSSFKVAEGQEIIQPGKIYFMDNMIYVNEYMKGIHVIDNSDPEAPQILKFVEIPGNVDLAIRGNILYADSYIDLIAIDISSLEDIKEVARVENVFPYMTPAVTDGIIEPVDENLGVVQGWKMVQKTVEVKPTENKYLEYNFYATDMVRSFATAEVNSGAGMVSTGTGGSMARFTIYDKYLYAVDVATLRLFDISTLTEPVLVNEEPIGWNIETIFPYQDKLFIGSQTGMLIYSLTDPMNPEYISTFWHASSCDPVVVEGDYAYVTLRAGNICGDNESQLDVIDITNINNPFLLKEYPMVEPFGLGIDDSVLFVCDGYAGLKIYNASDPMKISDNMIKSYPDINAFDVIPLGQYLVMIGVDGLYQYDYTDLDNINQLSHIPIYGN
jgi:hypothetical protein